MKLRIVILLICVTLLNSCIVKSLQPFYTKDKLAFNKDLIGSWEDQHKGIWHVASFKEQFEKENSKENGELKIDISKEDLATYEAYKDGYIVAYDRPEKEEAIFLAMPFMVDDQLFLDFTPFYFNDDNLAPIVGGHLLKTHSAAKVDFNSEGNPKFSWLSEERIKPLYKENKIRLKHEKIGVDEDLVLTASSEELHAFLRKFMQADIENKWTKDVIRLKPSDVKPE